MDPDNPFHAEILFHEHAFPYTLKRSVVALARGATGEYIEGISEKKLSIGLLE